MPDLWTNNPEKIRTIFEDLGFKCGVPSRVLHPRDPDWTRHIDTEKWKKDVYIHW